LNWLYKNLKNFKVKRRNFLIKSGILTGLCLSGPMIFASKPKINPMDRIGITSYVFRDRFDLKKTGTIQDELKLTEIPAYFTQRFGVRNVEFWSMHFESLETSYLKDLKKSLKQNKCRLINIQVDMPRTDVSDPDATIRENGMQQLKKWIDAGSYLGSESVRPSRMTKSIDIAIESVTELTKYAAKKNIQLVVENHGDMYASNPEYHVRIAEEMRAIPNFGLIADFGNYPATIDTYASLKMIAPYTKLVSAKTREFDKNYNHLSYDFRKCIRIMEDSGYSGIYSLEHSISPGNYEYGPENYDFERITDWMIEQVKANI
jgi:sugar phosphate isomerase/epimerase